MAKKPKSMPVPKITKVKVTGKIDSLTDFLKLRLFEYSPQSVEELIHEARHRLLPNQLPAKVQKNVNRCLTKNPCFRSEGKGLWCLRLDGLKENDAGHRVLQAQGDALRLNEINQELKEAGKPEIQGEQKLVSDGRFIRLKDGRWGLIHWTYIEPEPAIEIDRGQMEVAATAGKTTPGNNPAAVAPAAAATGGKPAPAAVAAPPTGGKMATANSMKTGPGSDPAPQPATGKPAPDGRVDDPPTILPLARPALAGGQENKDTDFWDKLFPLKHTGEKTSPATPAATREIREQPAWEEIAAGAEAASLSLDTGLPGRALKEFSLINGGKSGSGRQVELKDSEREKLQQEIQDLRQENKNLLGDLEKLHRRKEELRQELTQLEEQLVNLRVERDTLKKRVSHLETRLMQLQGTLNKTVSDAQAEQSRLKQQLREQEYRLQTTLIANEDLERTVADLQKERQDLKRQLSFWPVRLALRLASLLGFSLPRERARARAYGR
ncbi:hypothetical protein [Neomoorella thermoacetica]|uniref:Uncharacterized protein n=1 Tax=Moorella thermoacetica (strain ATCC 39073 / JCM 9320) TaxID=264732 RepID=Q2RK49_MOOTA|nr:hypothetical protein [Moorella thermoacetica]AKX96271.1 chromosome partition protein Smc [Moorella thermoacetica]OIQ55484.1 chromosome partition protein Smc [Moorella thermoacetica]OIQ55735.1 chromosome partition protein Smc [Moorella thermoacetica]QDA00081.1 Chromosome partition protein Smc [Moorella thermoacetica]TYL08016.1 Chromosome partition protein Smc [Moorella thermoacetica]